MSHASLSGFEYLGTYSAGNSYGSWPWAARDSAANVHLVYRDWDLVAAAGHTTHGAGYYSKNGAAPVKKWDLLTEGAQVQDTWALPIAGTANLPVILRLYDGASDGRHRFSVSPDNGITFPAMQDMPQPTGTSWTNATGWAFGDFCPSPDDTKWYGSAYDPAANCYLLQTTDGHTFSKRSTIDAATFSGGEPGLIRMADGRIVCTLRNQTNGSPTRTCYSDDDGLTWSPRIIPNANATSVYGNNFTVYSPPRGVAVSATEIVILGRWLDGAGSVWHAQWVIDRNGAYVSGPTKISRTDAAAGGYFCFSTEPGGRYVYGYTDVGTNGGDARVFRAALKLAA